MVSSTASNCLVTSAVLASNMCMYDVSKQHMWCVRELPDAQTLSCQAGSNPFAESFSHTLNMNWTPRLICLGCPAVCTQAHVGSLHEELLSSLIPFPKISCRTYTLSCLNCPSLFAGPGVQPAGGAAQQQGSQQQPAEPAAHRHTHSLRRSSRECSTAARGEQPAISTGDDQKHRQQCCCC
jgi:hypothetical protein